MVPQQQIDEVAAYLAEHGVDESAVSVLRSRYPDCHFTLCIDDDVHFDQACLQRPDFNLYLVGTREHCATLTTYSATATGVVIGEIME